MESKRVLCIEDHPEMIELIRLILGRQGFEVEGAVGGREGLRIMRDNPPDLVLLDLMMPEMDGFDVIEAIRARKDLADTRIIVITAKTLTSSERRRLSGQIESLLHKGSFLDDDLLEQILSTLR